MASPVTAALNPPTLRRRPPRELTASEEEGIRRAIVAGKQSYRAIAADHGVHWERIREFSLRHHLWEERKARREKSATKPDLLQLTIRLPSQEIRKSLSEMAGRAKQDLVLFAGELIYAAIAEYRRLQIKPEPPLPPLGPDELQYNKKFDHRHRIAPETVRKILFYKSSGLKPDKIAKALGSISASSVRRVLAGKVPKSCSDEERE